MGMQAVQEEASIDHHQSCNGEQTKQLDTLHRVTIVPYVK